MTPMIRVSWDTGRPGGRVYIAGHRWHHGMAGLMAAVPAAAIIATHHHPIPPVALAALALGVIAMRHDWRDFPWTSDRDRYTFSRTNPHPTPRRNQCPTTTFTPNR